MKIFVLILITAFQVSFASTDCKFLIGLWSCSLEQMPEVEIEFKNQNGVLNLSADAGSIPFDGSKTNIESDIFTATATCFDKSAKLNVVVKYPNQAIDDSLLNVRLKKNKLFINVTTHTSNYENQEPESFESKITCKRI